MWLDIVSEASRVTEEARVTTRLGRAQGRGDVGVREPAAVG